jgi:hypothetical protein
MKKRWRNNRRKKRNNCNGLKRHPGRNFHHLFELRCRGGSKKKWNLLLIDIERHEAWHRLFGLLEAEEVLALLMRVVRAKQQQFVSSF